MTTKNSNIDKTFVRNLKQFAKNGYDFGNGHKLRKGTQHEAFNGFTEGLNENHRHGYFEIPTGVGKTAVFISLIKKYLDAVNGSPDAPRVLIAVPSTDLVVQTAKAFAKFTDLAPLIEADDDKGREIDWEKSDVGVQYGVMKHADRKPKVLITTYQSLCKDTGDETYPPSEYGFVIYDEGHNTTADKFGTAIDKFQDSIQLAVTATPEYSENKTVAKKLPHCYFRLPLAEAINRGDLCPVEPALIKTNYTIDKNKFEKFVAQQEGRFLTKKQYESLLNQEARNTAAIKTYLLGKDPHTDERYFGQTGMIFAGGIAHCDDFTRQMNNVINTPQYKSIRDWLNAEGVALIAPLHNKIKTVELTIDGQKRAYTKDEIKDLHRRGKILLLISDKELKEGTDFPRDSIIMEMVDRLSVVDATQRYGRGFRLDLPDPEHNNPKGDPHKRCKVFNLIDNNTYEIYADEPQMLPIYCAEILEGAEFREPLPRAHLLKRFKHDMPDVNDKLEKSGFEVITDIERVRKVSTGFKKKRDEAKEGKPENVLSLEELSAELQISKSQAFRLIDKLKKYAIANAKESTIDFFSIKIPKILLVEYNNDSGKRVTGITVSAIPLIKQGLATQKGKPDNVWSGIDLGDALGIEDTKGGYAFIDRLKRNFDDPNITQANLYGVIVPKTALVTYSHKGRESIGIIAQYGAKIATAYKQQLGKPVGVVSSAELGERLGMQSTGEYVISTLKKQLDNREAKEAIIRNVMVPRTAIVAYNYNSMPATGIIEAYADKIVAAYKNVRPKTDDIYSDRDIADAAGQLKIGMMAILRKQFKDPKQDMAVFRGVAIHRDEIVEYDGVNGKPAWGITKEAGLRVIASYAKSTADNLNLKCIAKNNNDKSTNYPPPQPSENRQENNEESQSEEKQPNYSNKQKRHSIVPKKLKPGEDGDDLKRTGRSLKADD